LAGRDSETGVVAVLGFPNGFSSLRAIFYVS
jgi:hypothetical protein